MTKQVVLYGNTVKLKRVRHGHVIVWASNPEEVLIHLKQLAAGRKKVVKTTQRTFNRSFTKKGGEDDG